jgi:glucosamine-6-phosphate deaminase
MQIIRRSSATRAAAAAAALLMTRLTRKPSLVIGLPTGHTPIPLYRALARAHRAGRADFSHAVTFNLDEFCGLGAGDAGSYHSYMTAHLFSQVNLRATHTHVLDGRAKDWRREVARYERLIAAAGGLDMVILGIGHNGHLGFNEPADTLTARTHRTALREGTRKANAALFGDRWQDVPTHALSMGIGTILNARCAVLVATGAAKARIVARALAGPVTTRVPASLLQVHPHVIVVLDRDAAAALPQGFF